MLYCPGHWATLKKVFCFKPSCHHLQLLCFLSQNPLEGSFSTRILTQIWFSLHMFIFQQFLFSCSACSDKRTNLVSHILKFTSKIRDKTRMIMNLKRRESYLKYSSHFIDGKGCVQLLDYKVLGSVDGVVQFTTPHTWGPPWTPNVIKESSYLIFQKQNMVRFEN